MILFASIIFIFIFLQFIEDKIPSLIFTSKMQIFPIMPIIELSIVVVDVKMRQPIPIMSARIDNKWISYIEIDWII